MHVSRILAQTLRTIRQGVAAQGGPIDVPDLEDESAR
jgi:hypothetical protein